MRTLYGDLLRRQVESCDGKRAFLFMDLETDDAAECHSYIVHFDVHDQTSAPVQTAYEPSGIADARIQQLFSKRHLWAPDKPKPVVKLLHKDQQQGSRLHRDVRRPTPKLLSRLWLSGAVHHGHTAAGGLLPAVSVPRPGGHGRGRPGPGPARAIGARGERVAVCL